MGASVSWSAAVKLYALFLFCVLPAFAKDIREIRFPFGDEKELSAFVALTEPQLHGELQQRVWRNGLKWMREESDRKRVSFSQWLRGMSATDMVLLGYTAHCKVLSDEIELLAKEAREKDGKEAARLKTRAAELSRARDAISSEVNEVVFSRRELPAEAEAQATPRR